MRAGIIAGLIVGCLCVAAMLWPGARPTKGRSDTGIIVIRSDPPPPVLRAPGADAAARLSSSAAGIATDASAQDPRQLYALVRQERRDPLWASRAEAAIKDRIASVADIGRDGPLDVLCGVSICEATGVAAADAPPETLARAWEALQRATGSAALNELELISTASRFGSGHSLHAYTLYYRRTA
ncbi:hypothetical protein [Sphingomonas sp. PAMC 26621]|uniref:hypothetical protein n=1 Tax=Sphingomonas sp. PAMC 26621 TaxID=1112213 RepID=UPI0002899446|nr:hypothetical protein [Sphingomonas sp. PAMC 26621]